ncbi:SH3 domain-containing protein [Robbsia sp. KACC 23696]|uniref:SH3 domain-containing protein n=1 Tax=Robbsia sp. KACC 23696 TaxID=3149231 RepID=UPI00325B4787
MTAVRDAEAPAPARVPCAFDPVCHARSDARSHDTGIAGKPPRIAGEEHAVIFRIARGACLLGATLLAACSTGPTASSSPAAHTSAYIAPAGVSSDALPPETVLSKTASIFPLDRYDQNVDRWIDPTRPDYRTPLLPADVQQQALQALLAGYFGRADSGAHIKEPRALASRDAARTTSSPWDPDYVAETLGPAGRIALAARIEAKLRMFSTNGPRQGFGQNLRPYPEAWLSAIRANIALPGLLHGMDGNEATNAGYQASRRAISVVQASIRLLPTDDPFFYDPRLPGEGYPFDNLQESTIAPGTPLYVVGQTRDRAWDYVLSPGLSGWVRSETVGSVDAPFVGRWRGAAYAQLVAVTGRDVTLLDTADIYRFDAPIGTVLPAGPTPGTVLAPALDPMRRAVIVTAVAPAAQWQPMPLAPTPQNMAALMKALQGRPYGWGGTGFYNDCSLDLHDLMLPFGLVLPRHSSFQVEGPAMVDLSDQDESARLAFLMTHGRPFFTIIHIAGHVMLYLGNGMVDGRQVALVYEDMWGLAPGDRSRRAIVGQSAIMPLLSTFPEDPALQGQAGGKIFRLGFNAQGLAPLPLADSRAVDPSAGRPIAGGAAPSADGTFDGIHTVTPDTPADGH